jgi:peroxiredoxin
MDLTQLPDSLPRPVDDGKSDHLMGMQLPEISLPSTAQEAINLADLSACVVLYVYPMTGRPDTPLPDDWDATPGARGCTPQSCGFKDASSELQLLNTQVFGVSCQASDYQLEAKQRLHLPFELLSDTQLRLKDLLQLPTFEIAGMELYKRITIIVEDGMIVKVFYPVFPPGDNADEVIAWLKEK